jgi:hypothetical protein
MTLPIMVALWAFMRANPGADFDAFIAAYHRAAALAARAQEREQEQGQKS